MSTASSLPLMTCEQFFELPEPAGGFTYELHFGEPIKAGRPKKKHYDFQRTIREILVRILEKGTWEIDIEMPYGLTTGYDARAADVGVCSRRRWQAVAPDDFLIGSPELVVQIKSRSNRDRKLETDAITHITHGASAVLLIKPEKDLIVMITATDRTTFGPGSVIALPEPLSSEIPVDEILSAATHTPQQ